MSKANDIMASDINVLEKKKQMEEHYYQCSNWIQEKQSKNQLTEKDADIFLNKLKDIGGKIAELKNIIKNNTDVNSSLIKLFESGKYDITDHNNLEGINHCLDNGIQMILQSDMRILDENNNYIATLNKIEEA